MTVRCNNCFKEYDNGLDICPHCGYEDGDPPAEPYFLFPGMVINDRYIVGEVLGFGGFGTTYKAWDKSLNTVVAVKEYYYTGIVTRQPGTQNVMIYAQNRREEFHHFLKRFLDEARHTAKFFANKNIVNVFEFFEANNTAYMVMEFLDGTPLNEFLKESTMDTEQAVKVMQSICAAVKAVHAAGIIHRDISPDNIFLCSNGIVKLIDFGAARFSKHESQQVSRLTQVMKPGFSPPEQYQSVSEQGPWTDIYAMGATLYFMITGIKPEESTNRKTEDKLAPPQEVKPDLPGYINDTILRAMAVDTHLRFTTVDEFEKALIKEKKVLSVAKEKKRRWKNRLIGLLAAVLVVGTGFSAFAYKLNQQKLAETLPDSTIAIWYELPGSEQADNAKAEALNAVVKIFNESFPNVKIQIKPYTKEAYANAINTAYREDALPPLFESTGLDDKVLTKTANVSTAVATVDSNKILFFKRYNEYFPEKKQFPIGFIAKASYTNTKLQTEVENSGGSERERFLAGLTSKYSGTTADFKDINIALPARFTIEPVTDKNALCEFSELWSIGKCDENQLKAANRLLVFFLSENAQDYMIIRSQSTSLPLNKEILRVFSTEVYNEFEVFYTIAEDFKFKVNN